jgi:protein-disulfide isomerase
MNQRFDRILTTLLVAAAVAIAIAVAHREFFAASDRGTATIPRYMPDWRSFSASGRTLGDSAAPVTILEFADLECPFCRVFSQTLNSVTRKYPGRVNVVFVHLPIPAHRHAFSAARAVECAEPEGKFGAFVDYLYDHQVAWARRDSIDAGSWTAYAHEAGVLDTLRFSKCMREMGEPQSITAGVALATRLAVTATPTVVLNGWRYATPPSEAELMRAVSELLAGKNPYSLKWRIQRRLRSD